MTTRWLRSRWVPGRSVCGGAGGGPGGAAVPPMTVDLQKITPSPLELGAELPNTTTFNSVITNNDGPLISKTIQDDDGNGPVNVLGQADPIPNGGMGFVYTRTAIGGQVNFTLTADDGRGPVQDVEVYTWLPRVYLGVAALAAVDEAFVEALSESELRADKGIARSGIVWTAGEYLWVAFPQAFNPTDPLDFLVGVFPGGFVLDTVGLAITPNTPNGIPVLYDVWRSTGSGIGATVDVAVTP